jgi:hypothetical protein
MSDALHLYGSFRNVHDYLMCQEDLEHKNARGNGSFLSAACRIKTLTSFKFARPYGHKDHIYKCVFVIGLNVLDFLPREKFNKFQECCIEQKYIKTALVEC